VARRRVDSRNRARQALLVRVVMFSCSAFLLTTASPALQAPHSDEASPEREAWYLVRHRCFLCHEIDRPETKFAPSLMGLFERGDARMINGKPINEQTVTEVILAGGPNMPAFQYTLTARQIGLILRYLKGGFPNAPKQDGRHMQEGPR